MSDPLRRALYLLELGRLDSAESLARQVLATEPDSAPALQVLAHCYAADGRYAQMLSVSDRAAEITPDDSAVHRCRALALVGLSQGRAAQAAARQARLLDPTDHHNELILARASLAVGGTAALWEAVEAVTRARRLGLEIAEVYVTEGHVYRWLAEFGRARTAYRRALRIEPEQAAALQGLAYLDTAQGRMLRASAALNDSLLIRPDDPSAVATARRAAQGTLWLLTDAGCLGLIAFFIAANWARSLTGGSAGTVVAVVVTLVGIVLAGGFLRWRLGRLPAATRALIRQNRWRYRFVAAPLRVVLLAAALLILAGTGVAPTHSPGPARVLAYLVLAVAVLVLLLRARSWFVTTVALLVRRLWFRAAFLIARTRSRRGSR